MASVEAGVIFATFIKEYLQLDDNQVFLDNQEFVIDNDTGLYITVGLSDSTPIINNRKTEEQGDGSLLEIITSNNLETYSINAFSQNRDCIQAINDIRLCFSSVYARQLQELYEIKINKISGNILNTSAAEGATMLNRRTLTISAYVWYRLERTLQGATYDYFDTFTIDDINTEA
jgi:hypothetical protein